MFGFYLIDEGSNVRNGFNFYKLGDEYNFGVKIRFGLKYLMLRYSKKHKMWTNKYMSFKEKYWDEYLNVWSLR